MNDFIDTRSWPLVYLHMPAQVPDTEADARLAQFKALYTRAEPFVLLMDGEELPRHSPRFVSAYVQWSRDNVAQQRLCAGAIRIEADLARRCVYEEKARAWDRAEHAPYPFRIAATHIEAHAQARAWLEQRNGRARMSSAPRDARRSP
ncbi:hypothetical protein DM82_4188 [Burkholderia oklahomensis]|uniref:Uncharacterized protein n=2 Tax=Burkholderia oklahomensis TaxID=342113 RepID=A0AAI8BC57_9BURK|nr:hypothetical protein [Burkholderia oklahomensis]AIO69294.1 hypothetical protein DM82_4188 [Burkholderia oklahomensis]AOI40255.1 hypothetical protein WG70_11940 [Burkholderia oklahomensis EO147]KUY65218.1 hypothetical protein WG70_28850 [Burkholderia oklahomensis EO147]QPS41750.1 hypothetical protein I6G57_26360 [Burkholderia oklahomensis]